MNLVVAHRIKVTSSLMVVAALKDLEIRLMTNLNKVAMAVPTAAKLDGAAAIAVTKHLVNINAAGLQEMTAKMLLPMTKTQLAA